jgi:hypothetical protein
VCRDGNPYCLLMDRTDYKCNLEYRAAVTAQILALASGLLAGEIGIIKAARRLRTFRDGVEPEIGALLLVFVAIDSDTDALPIGKERTLWNREALAREDVKISAAERWWRNEAIEAATQLVRLLEPALPGSHADSS